MKPKDFTEMVRETLASPLVFVVAAIAYLVVSTAATFDRTLDVGGIEISTSLQTFLVFLFGVASFYVGIRTGKYALKLSYTPVLAGIFLAIIASYYVLGLNPIFSAIFALSTLLICYVLLFSRVRWEYVFATGTFLLWMSYALSGLPIMDVSLHKDLFTHVNPMFMTGFFLMTYSLAMSFPARRYLWLFLFVSLSLSTFRLYLGIALVTWILLELNDKKTLKNTKLLSIGIVTAAVFFVFVITGHSLMSGEYPAWQLDPLKTAEHRLAFTMSVFDDIVNLAMPYGHTFGATLSMESTEFMCRYLYGYECRITSTSFGESMLNFGIIGVFIVAWWCGTVLGNLRKKDYKLYAILMAMLISTLDVGINIIMIIGFIYLGWVRVIRDEKR